MTPVHALISRCGEHCMILRGAAVLVSVVHPPHDGQRFLRAHLVLDCSGEPEAARAWLRPARLASHRMILIWQRWVLQQSDALGPGRCCICGAAKTPEVRQTLPFEPRRRLPVAPNSLLGAQGAAVAGLARAFLAALRRHVVCSFCRATRADVALVHAEMLQELCVATPNCGGGRHQLPDM